MNVAAFLLTICVAYTLVFAIQEQKLPGFMNRSIEWVRGKVSFFDRMLECSFCLGFWMGLVAFGLVYVTRLDFETLRLWLVAGLACAATSYVFNQITLMGGGVEELHDLPPELQEALNEHMMGASGQVYEGMLDSNPPPDWSDGFEHDCHGCGLCDDDPDVDDPPLH
jgi:hypothetical protein